MSSDVDSGPEPEPDPDPDPDEEPEPAVGELLEPLPPSMGTTEYVALGIRMAL